jgi:hypothetical protein
MLTTLTIPVDAMGFVQSGPLAGLHAATAEDILDGRDQLTSVDGRNVATTLGYSPADAQWTVRHAGEVICVEQDLDEAAAAYRRLAGVR